MPKIKKFLLVGYGNMGPEGYMDTHTQDQLLDSPLIIGPVVNNYRIEYHMNIVKYIPVSL